MINIIVHGLGGQGAVIASYLIARAAFHEGNEVQAFPMFGVERQGTPVKAFVRIDEKKINLRSQIYHADYNLVLHSSLIENIKEGKIIANIKDGKKGVNCYYAGDGFVNVKMVAYFAKITKLFTKESLLKAIEEEFEGRSDLIEKNKKDIEEIWK